MNPIVFLFMMLLMMMMTIVPVTSVTWKPAVTSTWKMKNCLLDDTKKDTTFIVSPMLNGY